MDLFWREDFSGGIRTVHLAPPWEYLGKVAENIIRAVEVVQVALVEVALLFRVGPFFFFDGIFLKLYFYFPSLFFLIF